MGTRHGRAGAAGRTGCPPTLHARREIPRFAADPGFEGIQWSPRWYGCCTLSRRELRDWRRLVAGFDAAHQAAPTMGVLVI